MISTANSLSGPPLGDGEVHVWRIRLAERSLLSQHQAVLSADELDRAARFHFERDKNLFVHARVALRLILASYLQVAAQELEFNYSTYGKPELSTHFAAHKLRFNSSHSQDFAVVAVTHDRQVGVDVEYVDARVPAMDIAKKYFSANESSALAALPVEAQSEAFYNCWTRKEAYIKARGEGLSVPLDQFDVSLIPGEPARLLRAPHNDTRSWTLVDLEVDENYLGALAVEGKNVRVTYRELPLDQDIPSTSLPAPAREAL